MKNVNIYKNLEKIKFVPPELHETVFDFLAHLDVAESEGTPTLITGDTGVGKSLFLNILKKAQDGKKPFEIVNCAHFGSKLADSMLFGFKKGAFTGAIKDEKGILKKNSGGMVVLDEIGELPLKVQGKLLKFIEDGTFIDAGGSEVTSVDTKIIGVTSRKHKLRLEFTNRFFEFSIPPLYKRRKY